MPLNFESFDLPKHWATRIKSALLCAVAFARIALVETHGQLSRESNGEQTAALDRLSSEVALLREELRIKDARLARIAPAKRPHYPPTERFAILALKAVRGWNAEQAAKAFLVSEVTIANWLKCADDSVSDNYLALREPVNRFPDFVRQVIQQLKTLCPTMGKVRIAQMLARAGLALSPSTVRRFLSQASRPSRGPTGSPALGNASNASSSTEISHVVTAKQAHHVWHIDFTIIPTHAGFWVPWFPFSWPQRWPFAYCAAVVVDHFSRQAVAIEVFKQWPKTAHVTRWLDTVIQSIGAKPEHLMSDKGSQFGEDYLDWCAARGIVPRFGSVGQHGAIAVVERFILSLKNECTRRILVPLRIDRFRDELYLYCRWYNEFRPHQSRGGRTPLEVGHQVTTAPVVQLETRPRIYQLNQRCRKPGADSVRVDHLRLRVEHLESRAHLPVVHLDRAA